MTGTRAPLRDQQKKSHITILNCEIEIYFYNNRMLNSLEYIFSLTLYKIR